jgi:Cellulose synthase subunit D
MTLSTSKQADTVEAEVNFLLRERISAQWACFLRAFSAEMQSQLSDAEYRELLRSMGTKMAEQLPIGTNETIEALEASINTQLHSIQWGYVKLVDAGNALCIHHHLNPLSPTLDITNDISGGFLEGVYDQWLRATGADAGLSVKQILGSVSQTTLEFQFGQH